MHVRFFFKTLKRHYRLREQGLAPLSAELDVLPRPGDEIRLPFEYDYAFGMKHEVIRVVWHPFKGGGVSGPEVHVTIRPCNQSRLEWEAEHPTTREVCARLGISEKKLRALRRSGAIAVAIKHGGAHPNRYRLRDVERLASNGQSVKS